MKYEKKPIYDSHSPHLTRPSRLLSLGMVHPIQPALLTTFEKPLRFAIKRHRATNLHTDYRLEVFDTLFSAVSWNHPSLDPRQPTQIREMPDHDPAYLLGERRIPDGAYGAGPMVVWDYGTYAPLGAPEGSPSEAVLAGLLAGRLEFAFEGRRMRGAFRLEIADRGWRLAKMRDEDAAVRAEPWDDRSIVTGRSLDELERDYQAQMRRLRGR